MDADPKSPLQDGRSSAFHAASCYASSCGRVTLYHGDCLGMLATVKADAIITDPPYPDIEKGFDQHPIDWLDEIKCPQLVFWSAVCPFPLEWSAIHIWHKPNGNSSQHYERIFERNGKKTCRVFSVAAILPNYTQFKHECENHPCQKPLKLIGDLVNRMTKPGQTVFDPYTGSGTTAIACIRADRKFIGAEKDPVHFSTSVERIKRELAQGDLFLGHNA